MIKNTINTFQQDKWKIKFSNMPSITDLKDMDLYNLFVKNVTTPDYNLETEQSNFKGSVIHHPISQKNTDLSQIQISFKVSEDFKNYFYLADWIMKLRYGVDLPEDAIRKNYIKTITINLLDNQKRHIFNLVFKNAFLKTVSSLSLTMGNAEEIDFTANFSYEEMLLNEI